MGNITVLRMEGHIPEIAGQLPGNRGSGGGVSRAGDLRQKAWGLGRGLQSLLTALLYKLLFTNEYHYPNSGSLFIVKYF